MKGSNSRFSHRPEQRYSNSAHIQGGMVTDADLSEAGQLHQARDEAQNDVSTGSGTPARNGVVRFDEDSLTLRQGWVLAEGKQGQLVSASGDAAIAGTELFETQADLPDGPDMPDGEALLYADLWERPVFALQDDYLADAGLHGAETSYRTRTMVQIKALPLSSNMTLEQAMADLSQGKGLFRRKGDTPVTVAPKDTEIAVDDCDPCADQVDITPSVPNALFRLEVVEVTRDNQGRPAKARFAWSMENAAAIETMARLKDPATGAAMKAALARDGAVYQYFSDTTEAQIGLFPSGFDPIASQFDKQLTDKPFTHVRRWDGAAVVNLKNSTVPATTQIGQGKMTAAAGQAKLTTDLFTVEIDFDNHSLVTGDYWLIELRHFASEDERVTLIGAVDNENGLPVGIEHHFCALFPIKDGKGQIASDAEKRRLSFPALTDVPATHVSFDPDCPEFFDEAENVADALNSLCDLDASQVAFHPPDGCDRFADSNTVDEALKELCNVQDDTMLTRVLRAMMDWGVVCGVRLKLTEPKSTKISWTAGTLLDRTGRLVEVKAGNIDLREVPRDNYQGPLSRIMGETGEICLSMAAGKEGALEFFFTDETTAFGPTDPNFHEAVRACIEGRKRIDFGKVVRPLNEAEIGVVKKLANVSANRKTFDGKVPLSTEEAKVAKAVNKTLAEEYFSKVEPQRGEEIKILLASAEEAIKPNDVRGTAREIRRMQLESAKFGIIAAAEEEDRLTCECLNALTGCPPAAGKFGHLVPVCCFKMVEPTETVSKLSELCDLCCRKQAMTWRAWRYYQDSFIDKHIQGLRTKCCRPRTKKPGVEWGDWFDGWLGDVYEPVPFIPRPTPLPEPEPDPLWPPVKRPGGGIMLADPRWTDPLPYDPGKFINPKPDIRRLPPSEARNLLTGNGFDVVETLELDETADPFEKLVELGVKEDTVIGRDTPEPGDRVIMLASEGKAVDFIVLEKGAGKLPFETEAATAARVEKIVASLDLEKTIGATTPTVPVDGGGTPSVPADFSAFEEKLKILLEQRDKAEGDLDKLTERRAKLAGDVSRLRAKFDEMSGLNTQFTEDVKKSRTELNEISALKEASIRDISDASKELESVQKDHAAFIESMRREQLAERNKAESELNELTNMRAELTTDVSGLRANLQEMSGLNAELIADVEKSRAELKAVSDLKEASLRDISNATRELESVQKRHEEFVITMRREQPVESLLGTNVAAANALKTRGIVTVADIQTADTRNLTRIMANTGLTGTEAKRMADTFVKRR